MGAIMNKVSLKGKMVATIAGMLLILIALGGYSIYILQGMNTKTTEITNGWMPAMEMGNDLIDDVNEYKISLFKHVLASTSENKQIHENDLKKWNEKIEKTIKSYDDKIQSYHWNSEEEKQAELAKVNAIETSWLKVLKTANDLTSLSREGNHSKTVNFMKNQMEPLINSFIAEQARPLVEVNLKGAHAVSDEASDMYKNSMWTMIVVIAISLVVGIVVAVVIIRSIMGSINELLRISQEVANGNLSCKAVVPSKDELGTLGDAYNTVIENTKALIGNIQKTAEQVAASSEELTASAEQSAEVTEQVAQSITEVSGAANKQVSSVDRTNDVMQTVSLRLEKTVEAVAITADKSSKAVALAKSGNQTIENAVNQMGHIEATVNKSATVVTKLGQRSQEIGQIVDTISGIAGQTNLLALNAAIEAARAGEQGRGFAVVAEEVRKLAEQSQEAAKQIAQLISEIQNDTEDAVEAMTEGTKEVQQGADVVNTAGQAFQEILEMVGVVNGQANEISRTMEELANGAGQIVESVQEIDLACKNVAAESQTVSAATEEQSASMEEIAASSRSLANLAQELQAASSKFRI